MGSLVCRRCRGHPHGRSPTVPGNRAALSSCVSGKSLFEAAVSAPWTAPPRCILGAAKWQGPPSPQLTATVCVWREATRVRKPFVIPSGGTQRQRERDRALPEGKVPSSPRVQVLRLQSLRS